MANVRTSTLLFILLLCSLVSLVHSIAQAQPKPTLVAEVKRKTTMPVGWASWGKAGLSPGESKTIGSGSGPFFVVTGVSGGAKFERGASLDITLKTSGTSSIEFDIAGPSNEAGHYMALVY